MTVPGTPAVTLPTYVAPAFAAATVALGAVVVPVTLESTSDAGQSAVPFTFGQPFKQGELAPTDSLVGRIAGKDVPLQVDMKATWQDGSACHAVISGVLPSLPARASLRMDLVRAAGAPAAVRRPHVVDSVVVTIGGVEYTADTSGAPTETWLAGPFADERLYINVPFVAGGVEHPDLTAGFHVRSYGGTAKVDVIVEHTKAYTAIFDVAYAARVLIGGEQCYAKTITHAPTARWKRAFYRGAAPALHIRHDVDYLIESKAVPNFDRRVKMDEKTLAGYAAALDSPNFWPMGKGRFTGNMGTTGGRPEIGLMPDCYAAAILSMDKRAKDLMLASGDRGGSWPAHRRDTSGGPAHGRPIDILHFPYSTILGRSGDSMNRATGQLERFPDRQSSCTLVPDSSHQPAFAYVPYLLTGDYYYLEELHFWCNFNLYKDNPGYRGAEQGLLKSDQLRAQGWSMRTLAQAAFITPDAHPGKAAFRNWLGNNLAYYNRTYTDSPKANKLGIVVDGYTVVYQNKTAIGPWQDDFYTMAIGHVSELGFTEAGRLLRWKAKFQVGRMTAPGVCWIQAGDYNLPVRESETAPFYETLGECQKRSTHPSMHALPCNSPERLAEYISLSKNTRTVIGEMYGYADGTQGYPANFQPALAMTVDSGYEGGDRAWKLFDNRAKQPDYGTGPQGAIVPRAKVVSAPVPPVVVPPPAPKAGKITTPSNVKLKSLKGLTVTIIDPATLDEIKTFTNLAATSRGVLTSTDMALVPGATYAARATDSSGRVLDIMFPLLSTKEL